MPSFRSGSPTSRGLRSRGSPSSATSPRRSLCRSLGSRTVDRSRSIAGRRGGWASSRQRGEGQGGGEMTLWDSLVDVWSILAGVLQAPGRVVEELRRAASVLLHGIAAGEIAGNGYRSTESLKRELLAFGGTCAEGEEIAKQHGGFDKVQAP